MEVGSDGRRVYFRVLFAVFLLHQTHGCQDSPVGIADSSIIPDDRFTASSEYDSRYAPKNARLNGATGRGWGPKTNGADDYLQIDLGQLFFICAVATQGARTANEWTEQYKIATSVDNNIWTTYKNGNTDKLFPGNTDRDGVVKNVLGVPVLLRYIRFMPTTYNGWKVLRVEAYGLPTDQLCRSNPVGIGSGKIPGSDMTSSSSYNSTTSPSKARLNSTAGSSWCAATSDSSPYLQINLGSPYIICGIATQGDHVTDQWVQSYHVLTSNDGATFTEYVENSQTRSFAGNFDSSTAVKNVLYDGTVSQYIRVSTTSHHGRTNCMRTELYGIQHNGGCTSMFVGLSYPSIIPNHRFTASSYYDERFIPSNARLNAVGKAWTPNQASVGEWLQIDLGSVVFVCAVATQGAGTLSGKEFPRSYKLRLSLNNVNWKYYQENGTDKIFIGNTNNDEVVKNSLRHPPKAKLVRFHPVAFDYWPTMRAEVYGISSACSSPVGLEVPGIIQNSRMTSSSHLDNTHTASHGRLYGNSSWCSNTSSNTEYIQINLGQVMTVTGIATQGDHTMDEWVTTYIISYSMDGNLWNTYKDGGNTHKIFQGNSDSQSVRVQWLSHPVTARHVRVKPQTSNTAICMRIELYGCDYATRPVISGLTNQNLSSASNSYVDLVCMVQEPLIQSIKWYTGNTDITSQSTGLVHGANGVKQSTLRVNYTTDAHVLDTYDCFRSWPSLLCYKPFICRAMYGNNKIEADGIKSAGVKVRYDYPSKVPQPTVNVLNSTSVEITWAQVLPLNEFQKPVMSYVLVYQNESYSNTRTVMPPTLSHMITGLDLYTSYNITIKAVSVVGDGRWNQPKNFTTDSVIPTGFPTLIRAEALSSQSIRVTWQAPTFGINGPFLGYKVSCTSGSDRHESTATPRQTSHTFNGLRKWTVYKCTVVIRNDKGDGPDTAYVNTQTLEDAPGQPEGFQVTVVDSTRVQLDWALPSERNGIIRGFRLHYVQTGGNPLQKDISGNTSLSHVLTGLNKCTQYSFKILAYTIKDGPNTSVIMRTTAEDAPSAPRNLETKTTPSIGPSDPRVTLTWRKPVVCGDNVREYIVSYSHSVDSTLKNRTVDKSQLTATFPVWGGVRYEFRVRGVTNKEGPDTPTETVSIPVYAPSVSPSNLTFSDVNKTTFKFSWRQIPRSKSNGAIIAYEVNQTLTRRQKAKRSVDAASQTKLMNASCCSLDLHDLLVCAKYHISIKGYTSAGAGPESIPKSLETSAPGPPVGLKVLDTKKKVISLTWQKPESVTETVGTYTLEFEGLKDYNSSFIHSGSLSVSSTGKVVPTLYPDTRYTFRVSATTTCGKGQDSEPATGTTKVDAPPAPLVGYVGNITAKKSDVTVWQSPDINGQIKAYQFIVVRVDETASFETTKLKGYEEAEKEQLHYYIAAEIRPDSGSKFPGVFSLGDDKEYSGYENVNLKEGKKYQVLQRAMTQDDETYLPSLSVLIAKGEVPAFEGGGGVGHTGGTGDATVPAVVSVVVILIVAFVIVAAIFLWKRRNAERKRERERPDDLNNALDLNDIQDDQEKKASSTPDSRTNLVDESHGPSNEQEAGSTNGALHDDADLYSNADALRHQPIPINKFPHYVTEKKSGDNSFKEEFKTLSSGQQFSWTSARTPTNKPKNRYANIISYDHSRIILQVSKDGSDYINASYIHGFDGTPRTYIASQGPIPATVADFWQMVWQEKIKTVVMLTNLLEAGRIKCHQYWPDNKETYGPITVTLHRSDVFADYVVRVFILAKNGEEEKIQVQHFQYTSWPDKGVPQHATSVLAFRRKVRAHYASIGQEKQGPLLVHCSAGVGRTGAFIAVDAMLERTRKDKTIDIFNYVQLMRNNRITMVQTEEQYAFVHYAVLEALTCGNTEVPVINLNIVMSKLGKPRPKDQVIGYEVEFRRLNHISPALLTEESSDIGQKEENVARNRYPDVIPLDCARVFLSNEKQNYINASFANAYRERNAFILTQAPLKNTIYDFWHMVYQYKIGSIVMLNTLQEGDEVFPAYVPSEGCDSYHGITIEVIDAETKGPLVIKKCKILHPMEPQTPHNFIHVQHTKWTNQTIPESRQSILDLVTTVQRSQQQCGNAPIAVQCSDGVGRSGTFAAVYSLLERVKAEQVIDVFQTIKVLRLGRPNAVETVEQYKFCYAMVQTYLDSFNDYANFSEV